MDPYIILTFILIIVAIILIISIFKDRFNNPFK